MVIFTFASIQLLVATFASYIVLAIAWAVLWHFVKQEKTCDGKRRYSNFWNWWLSTENPSKLSMVLNWMVVMLFFFNVFRLICTLIFGFAPPAA